MKTGVFTGLHAINPVNGERLPVYVADYVLMEYGTGAIMAVPAHDERDREFAEAFGLPIVEVVTEDGVLVYFGRVRRPARRRGQGRDRRLPAEAGEGRADGLVSPPRLELLAAALLGLPDPDRLLRRLRHRPRAGRRAAGAAAGGRGLPAEGRGAARLQHGVAARAVPEAAASKGRARRTRWTRSSTPPGTSCATSIRTRTLLRSTARAADFWCPISQYIGGIDHATGHLLYSRFFVKVMNEMGLVGFREPFASLFHQGWVQLGGVKMSKSKGNVEGPDELVRLHGADAVRLYILFLGPADQDMEWTPAGAEGIARFLRRLWRLVHEVAAAGDGSGSADTPLARKAHETIAKVTDDIGRRQSYNTAIAAIMELVNELSRDTGDPAARFAAETAVSLIQPYAPHVAEELWGVLGHERLWEAPWPEADEAMLERETFVLVVQVNGRVRDRVEAAATLSRRRARRAGQGLGEGAGAPGRQGDPPGDRRAAQARELRRLKPNRHREGTDT